MEQCIEDKTKNIEKKKREPKSNFYKLYAYDVTTKTFKPTKSFENCDS